VKLSPASLTGAEIVELCKRYTMYDWMAQSAAMPIPVRRAEGVYFWDVDGKRYLDLNSQLMSVNIGHGHPRVMEAIKRQAERLPYISPLLAYEERAILGRRLAELWPGELEKSFFSLGGADANENALKIAKLATGRLKVLARFGATTERRAAP
jgi:taurine--2-oxoglutarate transaminase